MNEHEGGRSGTRRLIPRPTPVGVHARPVDAVTCPTCAHSVRTEIGVGWTFTFCRGTIVVPGGKRKNCNQHLVISKRGVWAEVLTITKADFERVRGTTEDYDELRRALGVVTAKAA